MISPLKIAVQGLAPGGSPLEIATQGLLISIAPPEPEEDGDLGLMPIFWGAPSRARRDCTIEVRGCRASLSATAENVAASMPSTEELDEIMWREEGEQILREIELEEREYRERQYWIKFNCVMPRWREHQARKAERKNFQQAAANLAEQLRDGGMPLEDMAAVIVGLFQHQHELEKKIEALESAKKPSPKKRK
jgi:hypothetical protein